MTFHNHPPLPRLIAPGGPVSQALRIMREADPEMARIVELRRAIATRIEADIELLDMLSGDPDFEPSLGSLNFFAAGSYSLGYLTTDPTNSQTAWGDSASDDREQDAGDEGEEENEHGGDIQDQPHDEDTDREPSLCGITTDAKFANGTDDGEPSLAGLGGTAAGCEGSQIEWSKGNNADREEDGGSRVHRKDALWRAPGEALSHARDVARRLRYSDRASTQIVSSTGERFTVTGVGRR